MLLIEDVCFAYNSCDFVLDGFSADMDAGEVVALLGPSGCGKSTVLRLVAGLLEPNGGQINWRAPQELAFVFQDPALMPWATVFENVGLPGRLNGKNDRRAVEAALDAVGLFEMDARFPAQLSGGQRMRASVARALAANPTMLLMDEPFAALDEMLRFQMNELLLRLKAERDLSILFVTHSLYEAAYLSDRVLVMGEGEFIGEITPNLDRSLSATEQRASAAFISAVSGISALMPRRQQ